MAKPGTPIAWCSFCTHPNTEVKKLVGGPGVYICDECVSLCVTILKDADGTARREEPFPPAWELPGSVEDVLALLPSVAAAGRQVEQNLTEWVRTARLRGATWASIGAAMGMTRQSAWERFSGEE